MAEPVFYKLRHKPTGLFFKPSKHGSKENLSKKGKVYQSRPTLAHMHGTYHHPVPPSSKYAPDYFERRKVIPSDWEVVEYKLEESGTHACS